MTIIRAPSFPIRLDLRPPGNQYTQSPKHPTAIPAQAGNPERGLHHKPRKVLPQTRRTVHSAQAGIPSGILGSSPKVSAPKSSDPVILANAGIHFSGASDLHPGPNYQRRAVLTTSTAVPGQSHSWHHHWRENAIARAILVRAGPRTQLATGPELLAPCCWSGH